MPSQQSISSPASAQPVEWNAEIFATRYQALRSRLIGAFLLLNWGIMGWFTIRAPSLGFAVLTLTLGLLAFVGGLSQVRAARRAGEIPLVRWNDSLFSFRGYSRNSWTQLPWSRMILNLGSKASKALEPKADFIEVTIDESRVVFLGWPSAAVEGERRTGVDDVAPRSILDLPSLEKQDRQRIVQTLRSKLVQTLRSKLVQPTTAK